MSFMGTNGTRQAAHQSKTQQIDFMLVCGGRGSCTFLLDEALTKQKVMTCEVVLTIAVAWLPNRAACWHSRGSIQWALQSWRWQRHILLTCLLPLLLKATLERVLRDYQLVFFFKFIGVKGKGEFRGRGSTVMSTCLLLCVGMTAMRSISMRG